MWWSGTGELRFLIDALVGVKATRSRNLSNASAVRRSGRSSFFQTTDAGNPCHQKLH